MPVYELKTLAAQLDQTLLTDPTEFLIRLRMLAVTLAVRNGRQRTPVLEELLLPAVESEKSLEQNPQSSLESGEPYQDSRKAIFGSMRTAARAGR
jgi:hypothetical protein